MPGKDGRGPFWKFMGTSAAGADAGRIETEDVTAPAMGGGRCRQGMRQGMGGRRRQRGMFCVPENQKKDGFSDK